MKVEELSPNFQKPGEIYFIRERDVITHQISPYTKIGLVGDKPNASDQASESDEDSNDELESLDFDAEVSQTEEATTFEEFKRRSSLTRMKEHQTGNSGILLFDDTDIPVVRTDAVAATEKAIHARFAHLRVRGEWFMLDKVQLQEAVSLAKKLSDELSKTKAHHERANENAQLLSTSEVIQPDSELIDIVEELCKLEFDLKTACHRASFLENTISKLMADSIELEGVAGWTKVKASRRFSSSKAKLLFPEIAAESLVPSFYKRFKVLGVKDTETRNIEKVETTFLGDELSTTRIARRTPSAEEMHQEYLRLVGRLNELNWARSDLRFRVKGLMGDALKIEGLIKWERREANPRFSERVMKDTLKAAGRLEDLEACMISTPERFSFGVLKMRPYPTNG
jgi:hypothetical protein